MNYDGLSIGYSSEDNAVMQHANVPEHLELSFQHRHRIGYKSTSPNLMKC